MFRELLVLGGPLMWPLLLCSILLGAVLFERTLVIGLWFRLCRFRTARRSLLWHRRVLPFFTDVPPSLGLLGTVVGVVQSFDLVDGRLTTAAMGAGLGVACMTTIFGLGIAIVASICGYACDWAIGRTAEERASC